MTTPRLNIMSDFFAVISASASLATWQDQLDWGMRITATAVAIVAGAITIWQRLRKKPRQ